MSTTTGKPPWVIIMATLVGVLLVYVLTWPPIDIKCSKVVHASHSASPDGSSFTSYTVMSKPVWLGVLYRPLETLCEINEGDNLLMRYYAWWQNVLG